MTRTVWIALVGVLACGFIYTSKFSVAFEPEESQNDSKSAASQDSSKESSPAPAEEKAPAADADPDTDKPADKPAEQPVPKASETRPTQPTSKPSAAERDTVSIPQLLKNLKSDNLKIGASAARSLGVIFSPGGKGGDEKASAISGLIESLQADRGIDLRREAAVALGRIRAESALDGLKASMSDEDVTVAAVAGESVGQILPVDEARSYLIERGQEDAESVRAAAYHGMAPIAKPEDAQFLVAGLTAKNWRTQQAAVRGLQRAIQAGARLSAEDYDAVALVLGAETTNAADTALQFFLHVRNEDAFDALVKAAELKGDGSSQDVSWRTRTYALRTLQHFGWPALRPALPAVIRQLGDRTANVSNTAHNILVGLRKEQFISQAELFPLLLTELEASEAEGQGALKLRAGIMQEMGTQVEQQFASRVAKVAAETLEAAMEESSEWPARAASLQLLGIAGYTGNMKMVAQNVNDDIGNVQTAAGSALEQLSPDCSPEQRDEVALVLLPRLQDPSDWRKTAVAARVAGFYATDEMIDPLTALLSHSVLNVREGASNSLVTIVASENKEQVEAVEKALYEALEQSEGTWESGAPVLGALGDPKAVPMLTKILKSNSWRAKVAAANAVSVIADTHQINDKPLADSLISAAQSETLQVQDAANQALRVLNKEEK